MPGGTERAALTGWGRTAPTVAAMTRADDVSVIRQQVAAAGHRGIAARGLGRSYGDAAQNAGGDVLDMTAYTGILSIDEEHLSVDVLSGTSLDDLMRYLLPYGLWLPVLPGTRQVTVGGAIAADIHGKNHHRSGAFGSHLREIDVLLADGTVVTASPVERTDLFWATVGGMGLTGIVLRARVSLQRVESSYFVVDTARTRDLDEMLETLADEDDRYPYSVAWFDTTVTGRHLGRAVLTRGRNAARDDLPPALRRDPLRFDARARLTVPGHVPPGLVSRAAARAFNAAWYAKAPQQRAGEVQDISQFFHPLDVVAHWNRLYGPHGFCQYQFVIPFGEEAAVRRAVELLARSGHDSCLNVFKRMGAADPAPLSFPLAGWTLAVDLPVRPGLIALLGRLDDVVLEAGGRVYLAKDSRLPRRTFDRMYHTADAFREVRATVDPQRRFRTDLSRRLDL